MADSRKVLIAGGAVAVLAVVAAQDGAGDDGGDSMAEDPDLIDDVLPDEQDASEVLDEAEETGETQQGTTWTDTQEVDNDGDGETDDTASAGIVTTVHPDEQTSDTTDDTTDTTIVQTGYEEPGAEDSIDDDGVTAGVIQL